MSIVSVVKNNKRGILISLFLIFVSVFFVMLFSTSTSPLYKNYYYTSVDDGGDSLQFQTIGMSWLNGKVPYSQAFDHKGPIIFFMDMIGLIIGGGSRYGIALIQIICLFITLIYVWRISQLAKKSSLWGVISAVITLIFLSACYVAGNSVQEYTLPFIMPGLYYTVEYLYAGKQGKHNPKHAFIYGIGIGACILLQLTHAIPLAVGILVISLLLIKQKQWKNLFQNLGFGILGILTIWLPFAIYFLVNGAFNDLFFASIIYNFSYATKIKSWLHDINSGTFYSLITTFFPCICALVTSALAFVRKKVPYAITLLIIFILETYLLCSGALFGQYCLAFIFQVGLLLNEIVLFKSKNEAYKFCYAILAGIIIVISHDIILDRSRVIPDVYNKIRAAGNTKTDCENLMDRNIGQIKNTTFTAYGDNPFKNIYLQYNLIPNNKFFVIQNWHQSFSNEARKEIVEDFQNNPPEYLLVGTKINNEALRETIENNYSISDSEKECKLYQKNI